MDGSRNGEPDERRPDTGIEPGDDERREQRRRSDGQGDRTGRPRALGLRVEERGLGHPPPPGSATTIRQPRGWFRSALISPPCRSTIQRAIARPSPVPPSSEERAASAR
jgi:hypothetical protein